MHVTRILVAITFLAAVAASRLLAQQPDTLPGVRPPRLAGDTLRFELPDEMTGEGLLAWPRPVPAALARRWADSVRVDAARKDGERLRIGIAGGDSAALFGIKTPPAPTLVEAPGVGEAPPTVAPTILQRYADLGMQLNARFELRFDRLKNLRCQPSDLGLLSSGCNSAVAPPQLNPQIQVRTGGVIGQRVHLDVDYDSQREFDASNNIKVYYQGLEDEVLKRVEVGNVTFNTATSQFITAGIPANNFGFYAEAQLGPLDVSGIFAQQKGNVVQGQTFVVGQQTVQPVDRTINDRDYEPDRFFFVVDPATLPGYPTVDILNLNAAGLPASSRVTQVRVYRRLSTVSLTTAQQTVGGIPAVAVRPDSPQRAGPFTWQLLIEGRDYYLDPSGLWFALTNQLNSGDYLAVSYVTADGHTVGTFPAVAQANRTDTLELIRQPQQTADLPTFRYAMRNVYRIGGITGTVRDGMQVQVQVAQSSRPSSGAPTFLSLLGMALATDQTQFDQVNRLFPRARDPGNGSPLTDYYIVFPSLDPFADSTLLPAQYRNDSLYRTPTYLLLTEGPTPLFQIALHYQAQGGSQSGTLSLGAAQIRPGSEKLTVGNQTLVRNVDYTIDYDIGLVTFLHPDSLFAQPTTVNVQYEEQPGFQTAPISIYGLQTRYDLGSHGSVSALGLLQQQSTNFTHPPLGFEASSDFVGGISGNFHFEPTGLTRLLNRLPLVHTAAPSTVTLNAELATSRPSPNRNGQAWVETFEGEGGTFLPLAENSWVLGSRPASAHGLDLSTGIDPAAGFQDANAASLVWQNQISNTAGGITQFTSQQIDPSIVQQGTGSSYETVLWMYMHPDTVGGLPAAANSTPRWYLPFTPGPRWRSMTLPLSTTGMDLSRVEYLEFWVYEDPKLEARSAGTTLVFDFGRVYEDAASFVPTSFTVTAQGDTVYSGRRRIGEGRLQTERDTLTNAWNALTDDNGIWGDVADTILDENTGKPVYGMPLCTSQLSQGPYVYPWGDQQARCTRHNGNPDTEDLDGDGHLDTLVTALNESYFRYVFHLGDPHYFVRDGGPEGTNGKPDSTNGLWRLYRIPFRTDTFQVGDPDVRQIRALRLTVVVPPGDSDPPVYFALARLELVGAPWVKRAETPIAGISGNVGTGSGQVIASTVSTENFSDLGYTSPPGVTDQGTTVGGSLALGSTQINETSLRLIGTDVGVGQRAEAYYQFPEGQRNFLGYREVHVWARGRGSGWNNDQLSFYIKVGQDENNFYMFRAHVHNDAWTDVVAAFDEWQELRSAIEIRYLEGQPPSGAAECGGDTLAYVACDSTHSYIVHIRDPGVSPPNLAQVRELAVGFIRDSGAVSDSAELWVDDIRLSNVVKDPGYAGAVNLHVTAADVADVNVLVSRRDAQFRQLGQDPSYVTDDELALNGSVRLEQFGLNRLGLTVPLSFQVNRSSQDPYYLTGTDVLTAPLTGLRQPVSTQTSFNLALRRSRRGTEWWQRWLVDNVAVNVAMSHANTTTELSQTSSSLGAFNGSYQASPGEQSFRWVPRGLVRLLKALPLLGRAQFVQGLDNSRLRWSPVSVNLSTGFTSVRSGLQTYGVPIATTSDTLASSLASRQATLASQAGIQLRPLQSLSLGATFGSTRDLRNYGDSTTIGVLTQQASSRFGGIGLGFEDGRQLGTQLSFAPGLFSWLRPRLAIVTTFSLTRDPNGGAPERSIGDTAGAYRLPTAFANGRTTDFGGTVDLTRALRALLGDSSHLLPWLDRFSPLDYAVHSQLQSQYDRAGFDPSLGYQFGWGGLDGFRAADGRLALAASHLTNSRVSSGLRLPLGLGVSFAYGRGLQQMWSSRGTGQAETDQTNISWPDVTGRWTWSPRSSLLSRVVTTISASAGVRVVTSSSAQPPLTEGLSGTVDSAGGVYSSQRTKSVPLSMSVSWAPRINTDFSYTSSASTANQTGSVSQNDTREVAANLSFAFRMPQQFIPLKSDVRTAFRFSASTNTGCLFIAGTPGCLPIINSGRQQYDFSMDTDLPPNVSAGLAVGYTLTSDAVNDTKFAQFTFTVSVSVNFQAGQPR